MSKLPPPKLPPQQPRSVIITPATTIPGKSINPGEGIKALESAGYVSISKPRKRRRIMMGTDGPPDTGKTEFILSIPGRGALIALDRGFEGALQNPRPPVSRNSNWYIKEISIPLNLQLSTANEYMEYWNKVKTECYSILNNPDLDNVGFDGDSDSYELQRLAAFGKLLQVPEHLYSGVNAARKLFYSRFYDAGKIVVATHKVRYYRKPKFDNNGSPIMTDGGMPLTEKTNELVTQGMNEDHKNYLWQIWLRHMYKPKYYDEILKKEIPGQFGIKIMKCKQDREVEGAELWGADCNFMGLVSLVFPDTPLEDWGF